MPHITSEESSLHNHVIHSLVRSCLVLFLAFLGTVVLSPAISRTVHADASSARSFFEGIVGDWVGACDEVVGNDTQTRYFRVNVKQISSDAYQSHFTYYKIDGKSGKEVPDGSMLIQTTVHPDGTGINSVSGNGSVLFDCRCLKQEFTLTEALTATSDGRLLGRGSGRNSVRGIPFGLGRNGKLLDTKTDWSVEKGSLCMRQSLKARYRSLCFSRNFLFKATYTAQKGSSLAAVMHK